MVPLGYPSFFARVTSLQWALRPERGLAFARRNRSPQRRLSTVSSCRAARGGFASPGTLVRLPLGRLHEA